MKINLPYIPDRSKKERVDGLTIITDYGWSIDEVKSIISRKAQYIDLVKLHVSLFSANDLKDKIALLYQSGIKVYFSGTLFEIFFIRDMLETYIKYLKELGLNHIEISDSSIEIPESEKLRLITELSKEFTVISEIGAKQNDVILPVIGNWTQKIKNELAAGAWKITIEGGEYGNSGIYDKKSEPKHTLIQSLLSLDQSQIIWETLFDFQQLWFINKVGVNVNLGNIDERDVLKLEHMRLGLHSSTFFNYIPAEQKNTFSKKRNPLFNLDYQI